MEVFSSWLVIVAAGLFLILNMFMLKYGARKVDDTLTIYLWKVINRFKKMK